ncbi:MAG: ribbon-helix-helix domain-containing protein [Planctomycetota bacterium]
MSKLISVRLPEKLARQLDRLVREHGRSRVSIIREALESYLNDCADLCLAQSHLCDKADRIASGKDLLQLKGKIKWEGDLEAWRRGRGNR